MSNPNFEYIDGKIKIRINDLWIEPKFDRYENLEPIGEPGANGVVIKGTHKVTGREDAIKIWLPRERNGKLVIREEQYRAEVQKISKLNDSRIVRVYDAWTEMGLFCCSMDYINGITYDKWLSKNYNMDKRISMLSNVFEAIVFYQSQGIIHGDIHTNNILIDKNEEVYIIDFGTSTFSSYREQSKHRENYLMYELIEKTLREEFDKNIFLYKKYDLYQRIMNRDDIRNATPILFSKSVLCYLHLRMMLTNLGDILNNAEDLYEYCRYIAKGYYLNMDYLYSIVSGKNEYKLEMFTQMMYDSIHDEIFEDCQYNYNKTNEVMCVTLYIYYEIVKNNIIKGTMLKEVLEKSFNQSNLIDYSILIKIFYDSNDLFEFHNGLYDIYDDRDKVNLIEKDFRELLFDIINTTYGNKLLHFMRILIRRIEEIKLQKDLYERIIELY